MNAILYVAGRATRLGGHTRDRNKVLLEFGSQSLLERHVMLLARVGVPKLFVVTGYLREQLQAAMPALQSRYGLEIEELYNADFTEGSVLSLHTSLPVVESSREGVLLMDGDVLYDRRMLERLLTSPHHTALLVDRDYSTADDDPVLVPMRKGKPFKFIKRWHGEADSVGESVGFFKLGTADLPRLILKPRHASSARAERILRRNHTRAGEGRALWCRGRNWRPVDGSGFSGGHQIRQSGCAPCI